MRLTLLLLLLIPVGVSADYTHEFKRYWNLYWIDVPQIQWPMAESVAFAESSFNPRAVSPAGARGLFQILPSTFRDIQSAVPEIAGGDVFDPEVAANAGCFYLKRCWGAWTEPRSARERMNLALASYNAGSGHIIKAQRIARDRGLKGEWPSIAQALPEVTGEANAAETVGYVSKITERYDRRMQEIGPGAFVQQAIADGTKVVRDITRFDKLSDQTQPVVLTPPAQPEQEAPMEQAVAALGVNSLFELLSHSYGYRLGLLAIALLVGVFVPPWAFEKFDRKLKYDTAEAIKAGHRWPAILACVQVTGIFAVIITGLLLLH